MGKYRIAVTSKDKYLVDVHFGHAEEFHIYEVINNEISFLESRKTKKYCGGTSDCSDSKDEIINTIKDCDAVITKMIGYAPQKKLEDNGTKAFILFDKVEDALKSVYLKLEESIQ
jgi:nitrogen fixation protein NifB